MESKRFGESPECEVELDLEMPGQIPITRGGIVDYGELPDGGTVA